MQQTLRQCDTSQGFSVWSPGYLSLLVCLGLSAFFLVFYFYVITPYVSLPADILTFSESDFVGDIIKLRTGTPIYTAPEDNNSRIYTPAAPIVTYAIAWFTGYPTSIVAWRVIQLGFTFLAAIVATACTRILHRLAYPDEGIPFPKTWLLFTFLAMFLAATAPRANRFVHVLHADSLALLISICAFWTLLLYLESPSQWRLALMAVWPAVGYLTKQFLLSWAVVMFIVLFLDEPKNTKRLISFGAIAGVFTGVVIGGCYMLWGDAFIFWTFEVVGGARKRIGLSPAGYHISLARSLNHMLLAWMEIAIGVIGGWLILRGANIRKLGPLWVGWAVLIFIEGLTSGVGWNVLYHFGPGVVIGMIWLFSALPHFWPFGRVAMDSEFPNLLWRTRPIIAIAGVLTVFIALHVVPTGSKEESRYWPGRHPSPDVYRYISDIEGEFDSVPVEKVLLDVGNWIYLRHSFLAKDRAVSLADQPPGGIYKNIEVMTNRIRNRTYAKILVRNFHSPFFLYDWHDWERPSGVKKALLEYYTEVRAIPAPEGDTHLPPTIMHTGPVSVLIPRRG